MLFVDIPTAAELRRLAQARGEGLVSIWLNTTPLTNQAQGDRIELKNLTRDAVHQMEQIPAWKSAARSIAEHLEDLVEDDHFWTQQANSLVVYATPDQLLTYRLPNRLHPGFEVADRFHLKPLLRAVTFRQHAFVLVFGENGATLHEVHHGVPATPVKIPSMPRDAASAVGKASINDPSPAGRIQGKEGQKTRLRQYARHVDAALRPILSGRSEPLILAATDSLASIYRSVNTYPHLATSFISGNADQATSEFLEKETRKILDQINAEEITAFARLFDQRSSEGRGSKQISDVARAATFGAVETLLVDLDREIPGLVDDADGRVSFDETATAKNYDVLDEIACRVLLAGGKVMAVRQSDYDVSSGLAAVFRFRV